jgi:hypothetical protein
VRRIGLVGCVKKKAEKAQAAKNLYRSTLFIGRKYYVERTCKEWWILSAKHRLLHPNRRIEPYNLTLKDLGRADRRDWSQRVLAEIVRRVRPRKGDIFEVHAGADYLDFGLVNGLEALDCVIDNPTAGMSFGRQLRFYKKAPRTCS